MNRQAAALTESAFAFDCRGDELVGFLHHGRKDCDVGILTIVAGGPQYRAGVARQLVELGRTLASEGYWVMRFDHRGIGDSEGEFRGFAFLEEDIGAAIAEFKARAAGVRRVVLWGGCDSATAALINAYRFPEIAGVIAGNPFVRTATSAKRAARSHYLSRLGQVSFWKKVARGEFSAGQYAAAALRKLRGRGRAAPAGNSTGNFLDKLLRGLCQFQGKVLFLMGDRFLLSDEFDALVKSTAQWRSAYARPNLERIDIKDGDQVFSSQAARDRLFVEAGRWLHRTFPDALHTPGQIHQPRIHGIAETSR